MMPYFTGNDRRLIEALQFDPHTESAFEFIKSCLVWPDERPHGLTSTGYKRLSDLLVARSFIHQGQPFSSYDLAPQYFERVWNEALEDGFAWPGFLRLKLSDKDQIVWLPNR